MRSGRHAASLLVAAILFACTSGTTLPSGGEAVPQQAVGSIAWLLTNIKSQDPTYTSLWTRSKELFKQVLQQNTNAVKSATEGLAALQNATRSRRPENATPVCPLPLLSSLCSPTTLPWVWQRNLGRHATRVCKLHALLGEPMPLA